MKTTLSIGSTIHLLLITLTPTFSAENPLLGGSRDTVIEELGKPDAELSLEKRTTLYYEQGKVILEEGLVTEADLLSDEELNEVRERRENAEAQRVIKHREMGLATRDAKLSDSSFLASPASRQLAFWQDFRARYPDIPVHEYYNRALEESIAERTVAIREEAKEKKIAALERRLEEAEARATEQDRPQAGPSQTVNVVVNQPAPVVITTPSQPVDRTYYGYGGGGYVSRNFGVGVNKGEVTRRTNEEARKQSTTPSDRIGQGHSVFRPPMPRDPLPPGPFAPL